MSVSECQRTLTTPAMLDTSISVILSLAAEFTGEEEKRCDAVRMEKAMVVVHDARRVVRANSKY